MEKSSCWEQTHDCPGRSTVSTPSLSNAHITDNAAPRCGPTMNAAHREHMSRTYVFLVNAFRGLFPWGYVAGCVEVIHLNLHLTSTLTIRRPIISAHTCLHGTPCDDFLFTKSNRVLVVHYTRVSLPPYFFVLPDSWPKRESAVFILLILPDPGH